MENEASSLKSKNKTLPVQLESYKKYEYINENMISEIKKDTPCSYINDHKVKPKTKNVDCAINSTDENYVSTRDSERSDEMFVGNFSNSDNSFDLYYDQRGKTIHKLERNLSKKNTEIIELKNTVSDLGYKNEHLEKELHEKNNEIKELEYISGKRGKTIHKLETKLHKNKNNNNIMSFLKVQVQDMRNKNHILFLNNDKLGNLLKEREQSIKLLSLIKSEGGINKEIMTNNEAPVENFKQQYLIQKYITTQNRDNSFYNVTGITSLSE